MRSDPVRGIVMLIAAAVAIWKGWHIHQANKATLAFVLAGFALAMAIWHFVRMSRRTSI